jgi:hypothetical protein
MRYAVICLVLCALFVAGAGSTALAQQGGLILNVPDWNQPGDLDNVAGYLNWCSPTAGGNIMGYWEDMKGKLGLADRLAFLAGAAYPVANPQWQQGLYRDGIVEMGWQMDTGGWNTAGGPFPPALLNGGTTLSNISIGLKGYATTAWLDPTGIQKVAYPISVTTENVNMIGQGVPMFSYATMWADYKTEIDAGRPVEISFDHWIVPQTPAPGSIPVPGKGVNADLYPWSTSGEPHSVVGVGYIDLNAGFLNNGADEYFVCQDGWSSTVWPYVAIPLNEHVPPGTQHWQQNDYVDVPEPAVWAMALVAFCLLPILRKKVRPAA